MRKDPKTLDDILVKGLSHILRRTVKVNPGDQLAIAQEYKEWINCISDNDFSKQEILVVEKYKFNEDD